MGPQTNMSDKSEGETGRTQMEEKSNIKSHLTGLKTLTLVARWEIGIPRFITLGCVFQNPLTNTKIGFLSSAKHSCGKYSSIHFLVGEAALRSRAHPTANIFFVIVIGWSSFMPFPPSAPVDIPYSYIF